MKYSASTNLLKIQYIICFSAFAIAFALWLQITSHFNINNFNVDPDEPDIYYEDLISEQDHTHIQHVFTRSISSSNPHTTLPHPICGRYGVWDPDSNTCVCRPGYTGDACNACQTTPFFPNCARCNQRSRCSNHGCFDHGRCFCDTGYMGSKCEACAPLYGRLAPKKETGALGDICVRTAPTAASRPTGRVQSSYTCEMSDVRASRSNSDETRFNLKRCSFTNVCLNLDSDRRSIEMYSRSRSYDVEENVKRHTEAKNFVYLNALIAEALKDPDLDSNAVMHLHFNHQLLDADDGDIEWILEPSIVSYWRHINHPGHQFYDFDLGHFLLVREHGNLANMSHRIFAADDTHSGHQQFRTFQERLAPESHWHSWYKYRPDDASKKRVCFTKLAAGPGSRSLFQFRFVMSEHLAAFRDFYMHSFGASQAPLPGLRFLILDREPWQNRKMLVREELMDAIRTKYPHAETVTFSTMAKLDEAARVKLVNNHNIWISIYGWNHAYLPFLPQNGAVIEIHNHGCDKKVAFYCSRALTMASQLYDQPYTLPGRDNYVPAFNDDKCHVFDNFNTQFDVNEVMKLVENAVDHVENYPLNGEFCCNSYEPTKMPSIFP